MNEDKIALKNRLAVVLIILVFIAPLAGSWLLLRHADILERQGTSSHGDLIIPPRPLPDIKLIDPLSETNKGQLLGKWSMLYIAGSECDQMCIENLYRMRQVRLATGKHYRRVQRVLLMQQADLDSLAQIFRDYPGQWLVLAGNINIQELLGNFSFEKKENPAQKHRLYIIDPLGNLMMRYSPDTDPAGIIKDLNRLLRASHIG